MSAGFGLALDFWSNEKPLSQHLDSYGELLKIAEGYGFNSVWAGENRPRELQPGHTPSPLLVLASLANRTSLRLGTGVTLLTLWHPLRLAYDAALLDHLSDGRFTLGLGLGSPPVMKRYGVDPAEAGSRMDDMLRMMTALWSGADGYSGKHFDTTGRVIPGPVQAGGPPLWLGGTINKSIERAVEFGDGWYGATQYHLEVIRKQAARYRAALEKAGTDPSTGTVAINRTTFLAPTVEQARSEGKPYVSEVLKFYAAFGAVTDAQGNSLDVNSDLFEAVGEEVVFVGTPDTCIDSISRYVDAGVTQFNLRVSMSDMPRELVERTIHLLGRDVLPKFL